MPLQAKRAWIILIMLTTVTGLLYFWYSLMPGGYNPELWTYFTASQAEQGRAYHRFLRIVYIAGFFAQGLFLVWFVFSGKALKLAEKLEEAYGYWMSILGFAFLFWLLQLVISFPFNYAAGYYWQHQWGFSHQTVISWLGEYLIGAGIDGIFTLIGAVSFFWIFRRWPSRWWYICALLVSLWIVIQSFFWPIVIAPLYNQFEQAKDPQLIDMVQNLSDKAGVQVNEILIMNASRQSSKANAYFSGLGKTKRIVLYDNLVREYPLPEIKAVVAHEIAHWSRGHIVKGIFLGSSSMIILFFLLALMMQSRSWNQSERSEKGQASLWAKFMLCIYLISFLSNPVQNSISRSMEAEADRDMIALTRDIPAAIHLQIDLAVKNLADIAPARFIEWFEYSHPSALERLEEIRKTKINP